MKSRCHPILWSQALLVCLTGLATLAGCYREPNPSKIICTTGDHCPNGYYCALTGTEGTCKPRSENDSGSIADSRGDTMGSADAVILADLSAPSDLNTADTNTVEARTQTAEVSSPADLTRDVIAAEATDVPVGRPGLIGPDGRADAAVTDLPAEQVMADAHVGASDTPVDAPALSPVDATPNTVPTTSTGTSTNTNSGTGTGTGTGAGTGTGTGSTGTSTGTGTGIGKEAGSSCNATGECQVGLTCLDGVCCTQATCPQCQNCGSGGTCTITVSTAEDTTGTTCTGTNTCNTAGLCKKKSGESCTPTGGECASGMCTDNRCCSQTCGACQACTGPVGTCVAVTSADDPDSCADADTCSAAGVCKKKPGQPCTPAGGECAAGTCTDDRCCRQTCGACQACTGAGGTCVAVVNAEDPDSCSGTSTCDAAGSCRKKDGQPCGNPAECLSGTCNSRRQCGPLVRCPGLAATCGPAGSGDCCASLPVPGGTFYRGYDSVDSTVVDFPATVASLYMDKYEVTVGRFRQFVDAGMGTQANAPAAGEGAHPMITGSGWSSMWNDALAPDTPGLKVSLQCGSEQTRTWTDNPGANENLPINCLSWYTAFAFCAWDLGRLPTEAEWNYTAAAGGEQRFYPWSNPPTSTTIDTSFAVYGSSSAPQMVGSKSPKGDGKWGQSDLAGNLWEWTMDWFALYPTPCSNCANLTVTPEKVIRGGDFRSGAQTQQSSARSGHSPDVTDDFVGLRCTRAAP